MKSIYNRVSRSRRCSICGKPDWCSYTPDDGISFCARSTLGANRISRTGWGVYYHRELLSEDAPPLPFSPPYPEKRPEIAPPEIAPLLIRDFVYRELIRLSPATNSKELIYGPKGLHERGLGDYENYGNLPSRIVDRRRLAYSIKDSLNAAFPYFLRQELSALSRIPGFWLADRSEKGGGQLQLWFDWDPPHPMLLIPYRNDKGQIQACQIRHFGGIGSSSPRYTWLSTPRLANGITSGSPLHFSSRDSDTLLRPVILTEGALKAEVVRRFCPEFDVIANAGIASSHAAIADSVKDRPVLLAFDMDHLENGHVAGSLSSLIRRITTNRCQSFVQPELKVLTWSPKYRGIDEALLAGCPIQVKDADELQLVYKLA